MGQARRQDSERQGPRMRRQGPRPLPLHLSVAALTWSSSQAALPLLRNGSPPLKGPIGEAPDLLDALAKAEPQALGAALAKEIRRRAGALLDGIEAYRGHPYRRDLPDPPLVWQEGTTRLLDYGATGPARDAAAGMPLLVVPSLINRAYILDLSERLSLLRWLARRGMHPFLVDWDRPGPEERHFSLTDYIAGRLEDALDQVIARTGRRPVVVGYCMGGLLALALALRRRPALAGLALLATPWDFHAEGRSQAEHLGRSLTWLAPLLEALGELPVDMIQMLFAGLDPALGIRKFLNFAQLDGRSARAATFVALEDWLNDGVPLAAPVARESLGGWYGENTTARGHWRVAGRTVVPKSLRLPSLVMVPGQDRIVPPRSAAALGEAIPQADMCRPAIGHIGMVVSSQARKAVWEPLLAWLEDRA